jgi:hypothetical protein
MLTIAIKLLENRRSTMHISSTSLSKHDIILLFLAKKINILFLYKLTARVCFLQFF